MFCDFAFRVPIPAPNLDPMTRARPRDAVRNLYQLRRPTAVQNVAADQFIVAIRQWTLKPYVLAMP